MGSLVSAFVWRHQVPITAAGAKITGIVFVYVGMALCVWAAFHLRGAVFGLVSPRLDRVVMTGPYRFVRHPIYLGTAVALLGAAISLRSVVGLAVVILLFLPSEIHRARLEEEALCQQAFQQWSEYVGKAGFFLPRRSSNHGGTASDI